MNTLEHEAYDPLQGLLEQDLLHVHTDEGELNVSVTKVIPEEDREQLWEMIETGFSALNSRSFELQSMAFDEFQKDVTSPDVLKYVTRDSEGKAVGYMTVHTDVGNVTWVDQDLLRQRQDTVDPGAPSFFVGTLVVSQEKKGSEAIPSLIRASLAHFGAVNAMTRRDSLVFFDCAEANYPWLAVYVERLAVPTDTFPGIPVKVDEIGVEYFVEDILSDELASNAHVVRKLTNISEEEPGKYRIIDAQHIYSIQLTDDEEQ